MSAVAEAPEATECPNCGALVSTPYCPMCGQENVPIQMSTAAILRDALEDFVKWDSKLLQTLDPLLRQPGFLTLEWARGRWNRYISPVKLYLTATFVFFLVAAYRPSLIITSTPSRAIPASAETDAKIAHRLVLWRFPKVEAFVTRQFAKYREGASKTEVIDARMPQALFVLLPLFALALRTIYRRPRRHYVEHLVFALHTHAFAFVTLTLAVLTGARVWGLVAALATGVYGVLALRRVYGQGWVITVVKGVLIGVAYLVVILLTAFLILLLTALALPDAPIGR